MALDAQQIADTINHRLTRGHVTEEDVGAVTPRCSCIAGRPPMMRHVVTVGHLSVMQCPACNKVVLFGPPPFPSEACEPRKATEAAKPPRPRGRPKPVEEPVEAAVE